MTAPCRHHRDHGQTICLTRQPPGLILSPLEEEPQLVLLACFPRDRMIVQYSYITWSPPRLAPQEALELGRQIAMHRRDNFGREFRRSLGKPKQHHERSGVQKWPAPTRYALTVVVLALCLFGL